MTANTKAKETLYIGGTIGSQTTISVEFPQLIKEAIENDLIEYSITYQSSNKKVAKVNKKGIITAVGVGKANIITTVQIGDHTLTFTMKVSVKEAKIKLVKGDTKLYVGDHSTYKISIHGYRQEDISWKTQKRNIAVVKNNKGKLSAKVTAKSEGIDYVKIYTGNGKNVLKIKVSVVDK